METDRSRSGWGFYITGGVVAVVVVGSIAWLMMRSQMDDDNDDPKNSSSRRRRSSRSKRPLRKDELWKHVKRPEEHLTLITSALGSNPIDLDTIELFKKSYDCKERSLLSVLSISKVFANEELIQLVIEKLSATLDRSTQQEDIDDGDGDEGPYREEKSLRLSQKRNKAVVQSLLSFVTSLCRIEANSLTFVREQGITQIFRTIDAFPGTALSACPLLYTLSIYPENKQIMMDSGVVKNVVNLMQKNFHDPRLITECSHIIVQLPSRDKDIEKVQKLFEENDVCDVVISGLSTWGSNEDVIRSSIKLLSFITDRNEKICSIVVTGGCVTSLLKVTEQRPSDAEFVEEALSALRNMCLIQEGREEAIRGGAMKILKRITNEWASINPAILRLTNSLSLILNE